MDPLAHTLTGAALAETSLARDEAGNKIPLATATLLLGANLPDVDVLAYVHGSDFALLHRRGWTHGVLAMVVLPLVLTGLVLLWDRFVRRRGGRDLPAVSPTHILWLSYVSLLTHPALDWLNNYGVRLLMPFDGRWFFGDAVFIVDPWMWLTLGGTVVVARRATLPRRPRIAVAGLALVAVYCVGMITAAQVSRAWVTDELATRGVELAAEGYRPGGAYRLMVGPVPVTPLRRQVVARTEDGYWTGTFEWSGTPRLEPAGRLPGPAASPGLEAALAAPEAHGFATWVRFPWTVRESSGTLYVLDARYTDRPTAGFGGTVVSPPEK